jgi:hypothetical protein
MRLLLLATLCCFSSLPLLAQNAVVGVYYYSRPCILHRLSLMANSESLRKVTGRTRPIRYIGNWWQCHDTVFVNEHILYRSASDVEWIADTSVFKVLSSQKLRKVHPFDMTFTKEQTKK